MSIHPVEKLWRECGLPEYFLGNGGTNTKLYALYDRIVERCMTTALEQRCQHGTPWDLACKTIAEKIRALSHRPQERPET
jgi:hypothetical protein